MEIGTIDTVFATLVAYKYGYKLTGQLPKNVNQYDYVNILIFMDV